MISTGDIDGMKTALMTSPIATSINADILKHYKAGIMDDQYLPSKCSSSTNHGVTIVGWDIENGVEYWKVRNSWGEEFGQDGYFKMAILAADGRPEGICGVNHNPVAPIEYTDPSINIVMNTNP